MRAITGTVGDGDEDIFLFTAGRDEDGNLVNVWWMPPQEARRRTMEERERLEARFRAAPFPCGRARASWEAARGAAREGESERNPFPSSTARWFMAKVRCSPSSPVRSSRSVGAGC